MRYRLSDLPELLRSPLGRRQLLQGLSIRTTRVLVAAAVLHRRFRIRHTRIIAVVGSFGKTTTTRCLLTVLTGRIHKQAAGNMGISLAKNILRIRPADTLAVVEVGVSGFGQMAKNVKIVKPDIAVVTSIGSEHNRTFGTLQATRDEKADMVRALGAGGLAFLNGDDPNVLWMAGQTKAKVVTFGFGSGNDFRASDISLDWPVGTRFNLHAGGESHDFFSPLLGRHMLYPVLATIAVASHLGVDSDQCRESLSRLKAMNGRLQPVPLDNGAIILRDDFKSSYETIHSAFDILEEIPVTRKIVVLGEVSEPPDSQGPIYRRIGEHLGKVATKAFFLCTKKSFNSYAGGAVAVGFPKSNLCNAGTDGLLELITTLRTELEPGDVLLLKGRFNQHLERIAYALQGRSVACELGVCDVKSTGCYHCPMLAEGWAGRRILY